MSETTTTTTTTTTTVTVGDRRELVLVDDLTRTQIVQYAGASGDYNPLHSDEPYATKVAGFPSVFAHGMLTMGMTGRLLADWFGDEALVRYGVRFLAQVWPGDVLTASGEVMSIADGIADIAVVTSNQDGIPVLAGSAAARVSP